MKIKPWVLLLAGIGWMVGAIVFLFSSFGIYVPGWVPPSLVIPAVAALELVLFLGWLLPLVVGIRLLVKSQ